MAKRRATTKKEVVKPEEVVKEDAATTVVRTEEIVQEELVPETPKDETSCKTCDTCNCDEEAGIKVVNKSKHRQLERGTSGAAGYDIRANTGGTMTLVAGSVKVVPTGVFLELPEGLEAQVRPRSGNATKGLTVVNAPGTVDEDYRGEVKVILSNLSNQPFVINDGDKIAQLVFAKVEHLKIEYVEELSKTVRGEGGFGHTGK